jgi:hypothetical protein
MSWLRNPSIPRDRNLCFLFAKLWTQIKGHERRGKSNKQWPQDVAVTSMTFMPHCIRTSCLWQQSMCEWSRFATTVNVNERHTAIVYSRGCQLACRIFLLKSRASTCTCPSPTLGPFFIGGLPGSGPPTFFALNADLSACRTMSCNVWTSNIRK